jgi:hypothetical protein
LQPPSADRMTAPEAPRHPTPPQPLAADVRRAVAVAIAKGGSSAELERIVRAYVRELRSAEIPPEQALRRVKDVVGRPTLMAVAEHGRSSPERLADDLVTWFVAEYYRAD